MIGERGRDGGIEPVARSERTLGAVDLAVLWGSLGVSLLTIATGAFLAPALSPADALLAILLGGVVASGLLAAVAALGAAEGVPGMVLLRRALGVRGSAVPTVLNVAQNLGWGVFETIVIAEAAVQVIGGPRVVWTLLAGGLATLLALLGPRSVVRLVLRRALAPLVAVSLAYLLVCFASDVDLGAPGTGELALVAGVDLVIGFFVSWLPLAADYTRFARSPRAAAAGAGVGYLVGGGATFALGALGAVAAQAADRPGYVAAIVAVPAGVVVASVLVADETEKAFANVYSTSVSLQNLAPRLPLPAAILATGALVTAGASVLTTAGYLDFLYLIGSLFVPLFAAVLADRLRPARPAATLVAWLAGFVLYQWIAPTGPEAVREAVGDLGARLSAEPAFGLGEVAGASLPALVLAFTVRLLWPARRRRGADASPREVPAPPSRRRAVDHA